MAKCKLRNALAIALGALFVMCILSVPAYAESVSYVDADGKDMGSTECSIVTEEMTEGWYVTDANHDTFDKRIKVSGNVNLILKNDTVLKAQAGIEVPSGSELTIWAQRTDKRMGCLEAVRKDGLGSDKTAGIGCNSKGDAGNITINGGEIRANGSNWEQEVVMKPGGPGISGEEVTINGGDITAIGKGRTSNAVSGAGINGKTININGGTVEATGGYWGGAGIGCNYRGASANVTINGGTVTATGGYCSGSGIGGAEGASFSGNIKITGGTVTTTGMGRGPGIGSSGGPLVGTITISGGDVTANGGDSDTHSGAGIGGPGLSGTIKISGGTVKATGGEYSAGIGSSLAKGAKDGHIIIEGGTVIAKGGDQAAGIGGGAENDFGTGGEGCDDVQITGGTVFAQSGTGSCSAIGHGDNDGHMGKITFANGMCVKADSRTDGGIDGAYERDGKPFLWQGKDNVDGRMSACQYRHTVLIQECDHAATQGENDSIIHVDRTSHLRSACAYCKQPATGEPHSYDESGKCTVCGYKQTICTVSFDANGGSGSMGAMWAAPGGVITLPECGFTPPENKAFAGWDVNGETVDENKPVKINKDTIVKAVWADAYPLWVGATQVSEVNYKDIFGNGTTKYTGDGSEGTLTLDGAYIAGITSQLGGGLKILVNSNSVVNVDADHGIYSAGPLMISGEGRLSVQAKDGIECDSDITISGCKVVSDNSGFGSGIRAKGKLTIENSKVTATGMDYGIKAAEVIISGENSVVSARTDGRDGSAVEAAGSITLNDSLAVVSPTGGKIGKASSNTTTILDKNGKAANAAVISGAVSYDVWVGETQVTSANYTDVLGNGRVIYDPDKDTLTFTGAEPSITGVYSDAMIYADRDLTIVAPEGGLTLENTTAAQGICTSGNLTLNGNFTINVSDGAIFAGKNLYANGDLTARGTGSVQTTGGLIEANDNVTIEGDLSGCSKTGSVINAGGNIDIAGSVDNTGSGGEELVPENGLMAEGDITVGGNVKLLAKSAGICSETGSINVSTGKWEVNDPSNGKLAMDAVKINIPDTHGVIDPEGGEVKEYTADEETAEGGTTARETVYIGSEVSEYATIYWKSPKPSEEPGVPAVQVTPDKVPVTYGGADGENRTLTATVEIEPGSGELGTLRYRWQRQEPNGYWLSVGSGVDMTEYTIPEDQAAGEYEYRCMVTNTLDGASKQAVSGEIDVTIDKADAQITIEPRTYSLTYNGRLQRLAMSGSAQGGTILYSIDNETWGSSVPAAKDAGTYQLYYMVRGDENHNDVSGESCEPLEVSIATRKLVITVDPKEKYCGDPDPLLTYQVEGLASGDGLVGQLTREPGEDVGTYPISGEGIEPAAYCKGNYSIVPQGNVLIIYSEDGSDDPAVMNVIDKINKLPAADKVTAKDKTAVEDARKAYDTLSESKKTKIPADILKKLTDAEKAIADIEKDQKARKVKNITVNVKKVTPKEINKAIAKAGGSNKYVTTIVLGKKVKKISKGAFRKYTKVKTLVVKTKKLKKKTVKKSLKSSKIKKVKVKVGKKSVNKKYVKKYKKIFTKKIAGKKVKVSL